MDFILLMFFVNQTQLIMAEFKCQDSLMDTCCNSIEYYIFQVVANLTASQ